MIHGYLNSFNIFVDTHNNIKIGDLGLSVLKNFSQMFTTFRDISAWSPPEIIQPEKRSSKPISYTKATTDVYSFGMLLWELITTEVPFNNETKKLKTYVVEEGLRPLIHEDINEELAHLIRVCWQKDPDKRANMKRVNERLQTISL